MPCDKSGQIYKNIGEVIVHKPETQLKQLSFLTKINTIRCMQPKYKNIFCQYRLFGDENYTKTEAGKDTNNPDINHQRLVNYNSIDRDVGYNRIHFSFLSQKYFIYFNLSFFPSTAIHQYSFKFMAFRKLYQMNQINIQQKNGLNKRIKLNKIQWNCYVMK